MQDLNLYRKVRALHGSVLDVLYSYYSDHEEYFQDQVSNYMRNRTTKLPRSISMSTIKLEGQDYANFVSMYIYPDKFIDQSVAEVVKAKKLIKNAEKCEMLEAVLKARFSIYQPLSYDLTNSTIQIMDVITNEIFEITDESLVKSLARINDFSFYLVSRLIKYQMIIFMNNAIVLEQDRDTTEFIEKVKKNNLTSIDILYYAISHKD